MSIPVTRFSRRAFLKTSAAAATALFIRLPVLRLGPLRAFAFQAFSNLYGHGGYGEGVYPAARFIYQYLPVVVNEGGRDG